MKPLETIHLIYIAALVSLTLTLGACKPAPESVPLPDPPIVKLEGFEAAVAEQITASLSRLDASPLSAQTNGDLAMLLQTYLQYTTASTYYQRARLLEPDSSRWSYLHAIVLSKLGERDAEIEALRHTLVIDENYVPATVKLAQLLLDAGEHDLSRELYDDLFLRHPNMPQALLGLGKHLLKENDDLGLKLLKDAVNRKGPYGEAHYALAEAYGDRGDTEKSDQQLKLFEKFRTVTPALVDPLMSEVRNLNESRQGLINRAQRLITKGQATNAIDDLQTALARDPSTAGPHSLLIVAYGMLGNYPQAESHYTQGLALDPDLVQLHNNFGTLRLQQKRFDEAAQAFRKAIEADPDYLDAYVNLGAALESSGKRSEAIKQYAVVVEQDPLHRAAGFNLGNAYMKQLNPHRAVEYYLRILEPQDNRTPEYLQALAVAYSNIRKYPEARATLQQAIDVATHTGRSDLLPKLRSGLSLLESAQ